MGKKSRHKNCSQCCSQPGIPFTHQTPYKLCIQHITSLIARQYSSKLNITTTEYHGSHTTKVATSSTTSPDHSSKTSLLCCGPTRVTALVMILTRTSIIKECWTRLKGEIRSHCWSCRGRGHGHWWIWGRIMIWNCCRGFIRTLSRQTRRGKTVINHTTQNHTAPHNVTTPHHYFTSTWHSHHLSTPTTHT